MKLSFHFTYDMSVCYATWLALDMIINEECVWYKILMSES